MKHLSKNNFRHIESAKRHSRSRANQSLEENIQDRVRIFWVRMAIRRLKPEKKKGIGEAVKGNG
jgi:hypothetical protein